MIVLEQPPTLLFFNRKGKSIDADDFFKIVDKSLNKGFLTPSGAGMTYCTQIQAARNCQLNNGTDTDK